jgi:glycosyltransferase involved in cell wall biosynthesis
MTNEVKANIAVCGRFHYNHYVRYLNEFEGLNRFYHSSNLSFRSSRLGIPSEKSVNIFPKEYLAHLHSRVLGNRFRIRAFGLYHDLWQLGVIMRWRSAPILHLMLHGNGRRLISRARKDGAIVIGEPVNSHPRELHRLLNEEHERLGIRERLTGNLLDHRLATEAADCDYLLTGSNVVKSSFARNGFPSEKIRVIPYGTDIKRFSPLSVQERNQRSSGLPDVSFRVICVGQITPRKGHIYLLQAWRQLNIADAELLFVGRVDPIMKPVLENYAESFRHIPHVRHDRLRHYYGASDVFVLPSLEDGFAYVCAEALGSGLPVVATDNTGASELLADGVDGFVVPVRSSRAIAEKLERLFVDKVLRISMSKAAVQKAASTLQWRDYAARLLDFYRDVYGSNGQQKGIVSNLSGPLKAPP